MLLRYDDIEVSLPELPEPMVVNDSFPSERSHGWKFNGEDWDRPVDVQALG